jgi:uncharacterized protein (TIGR02147 family)
MVDVFRYTHFGPYLRDWFNEAKTEKSGVSLQSVSFALGLKSKSLLHRLLNDPKATLSPQLAESICEFIGHSKLEREYFHYLVLFNRVRTPDERGKLYGHMHRLLERLRPQYLEDWQLDYFQEWYMPAVRELVDCVPRPRTPEEIASRLQPPITPKEARKALDCLVKMGLIKKRSQEQGWQATQKAIDTPADLSSVVVHRFQKQMLERATASLDTQDADEREIIASTFSFPAQDFERIRGLVRNFQNELTREILALDKPSDLVYQINVQLFPLSNVPEESK